MSVVSKLNAKFTKRFGKIPCEHEGYTLEELEGFVQQAYNLQTPLEKSIEDPSVLTDVLHDLIQYIKQGA